MLDQREYVVQLVSTTEHEFVVTARTEEEAISIAEGLLEDGDRGDETSLGIESADAYPLSEEDFEEDGEDD